jgi:hypothetical protein
MPRQPRHLAVGEHHFQFTHMLVRRAVRGPATSRGIERHHAADGGDFDSRWIGTEYAAIFPQSIVKLRQHDARLNRRSVFAHRNDTAKVPRKVDDQAATQRIASKSRPGAARIQRNSAIGRVSDHCGDVVARPRPHHPQRWNLKDARIAGVHLDEQVVAIHVAGDLAAQVFSDTKLFGVHQRRLQT